MIKFPKQLVIFIEENERIPSSLTAMIQLPGSEQIKYNVPVMKYWEYSLKDLQERQMYALLPLQVFKSRKRIKSITNFNKPVAEKSQLITKEFQLLHDTIYNTIQIFGELHDRRDIAIGDLERILRVIQNITGYLYRKYGEYQIIDQEVHHMIKTLFDPRIEQQGFEKGIEQGIEQGIKQGIKESIFEDLADIGVIHNELKQRIEKEEDVTQLRKWRKLAVRMDSIEEFVSKM